MLRNELWDDVCEVVVAQDFYVQAHRGVFKAIESLINSQSQVDFITVVEKCRSLGILDELGGVSYIGSLVADLGSTMHCVQYAKIVRDKSILRSLAKAASNLGKMAFQPSDQPVEEILDRAEKEVCDIRQGNSGKDSCRPASDFLPEFQVELEKRLENHGAAPGLPSGFRTLDAITHGFSPGDLVIVAGRPGMGKTSFAMNIAEHSAIERGIPTVVFSMEMSAPQLVTRLISSVGRIHQENIKTGQLNDRDMDRLTRCYSRVESSPLFIDESAALSPIQLRSKVRRLQRKHKIGLIVVDYIQLMQIPESRENRTNVVSEITRGLKTLAKETGAPVIALSQLNRALEGRDDKRPKMSDLRDSGGIEQDADIILFVHREAYYKKESVEDRSLSEIIVAKHRHGATGEASVAFLGEYTRFDNLEIECSI